MVLGLIALGFAYSLLAIAGVVLIKMEMPAHTFQTPTDYIKFLFTVRAIAGFTIIALSALIQIKSLSLWDFSRVIPVTTAIYFSLTAVVGVFLFKEEFTVYSALGMMLIIVGIVVMNIKTI